MRVLFFDEDDLCVIMVKEMFYDSDDDTLCFYDCDDYLYSCKMDYFIAKDYIEDLCDHGKVDLCDWEFNRNEV